MNRPQYILQPVNPYFISFSLAAAFLLNLMPWGRLLGVPDFVALVLLFWNVHQPRKVGMGIAFSLGLLMDVHNASLLGEHALAYTLLSYGAITIHRRRADLRGHAAAGRRATGAVRDPSVDGRGVSGLGLSDRRLRRSRAVAGHQRAAADAAAPPGRSGRYPANLIPHRARRPF
jgi:hypothetical protein